MVRRSGGVLVLALLAGSVGQADEIILPTFAWQLSGEAGNVWSSEVYVTNAGSIPVRVDLAWPIMGRVKEPKMCLIPPPWGINVAPRSSVVFPTRLIYHLISCPDEFVGGLVFSTNGAVTISSRLVNHGAQPHGPDDGLLAGVGQEIPGISIRDVPRGAGPHTLPALTWHANSCGTPAFETYLQLVNPGAEAVRLTLARNADRTPASLEIDGTVEETPVTITLPPYSWQQLRIAPAPNDSPVCLEPELFDLFLFSPSGPAVVYASVVDRTSQDARTVLPVVVRSATRVLRAAP
ncbi:MAG: hypothetical protein V1750_01985 [Acidobacteriota bacterium]